MKQLTTSLCPCGTGLNFVACCEPFINRLQEAPTPEALMRSRYCAYTLANIDYIMATMRGAAITDFQPHQAKIWAEQAEWLGLRIVNANESRDPGGAFVEFIATYRQNKQLHQIHEKSTFRFEDGRWYYVDGVTPQPATTPHRSIKTGRNDPCPCGSNKKYKKCCSLTV